MLIKQTATPFVFAFVVLSVSMPAYVWGSENTAAFSNVIPTIRQPEGDFIRSLTRPRDRIFVWGWTADPYLGSGRVTGTRDLNLFYVFIGTPKINHYYRNRLYRDLVKGPPAMFIDAVGRTSWSFTDEDRYRFQQFPEIAAFVNDRYVHLVDVYGRRYYLRRDLTRRILAARMPRQCAPQALSCVDAPSLRFTPDASVQPAVRDLEPIELPEHALLEARFTPIAPQASDATVFSNEERPNSFSGFRFQNIGGDWYRLILGLGNRWAFSQAVQIKSGHTAELTIKFEGKDVYLRCDGRAFDDMHLPAPVADTDGRVTVGSWINGQARFGGSIEFFQLVDLNAEAKQ